MEAKLVVVSGKASKREIPLKLPAVIGRSKKAALTVAHQLVSREHCQIYEVEGALVVKDNKSLNGTFVGGKRISEVVLKPGDKLTVGPLTFVALYHHDGPFPVLTSTDTPGAGPTVHEPAAAEPAASEMEGTFDFAGAEQDDSAPDTAELAPGGVEFTWFGDEAVVDAAAGAPAEPAPSESAEVDAPAAADAPHSFTEDAPAETSDFLAGTADWSAEAEEAKAERDDTVGWATAEAAAAQAPSPTAEEAAAELEFPPIGGAPEDTPPAATDESASETPELPAVSQGGEAVTPAATGAAQKKAGWWPFGKKDAKSPTEKPPAKAKDKSPAKGKEKPAAKGKAAAPPVVVFAPPESSEDSPPEVASPESVAAPAEDIPDLAATRAPMAPPASIPAIGPPPSRVALGDDLVASWLDDQVAEEPKKEVEGDDAGLKSFLKKLP